MPRARPAQTLWPGRTARSVSMTLLPTPGNCPSLLPLPLLASLRPVSGLIPLPFAQECIKKGVFFYFGLFFLHSDSYFYIFNAFYLPPKSFIPAILVYYFKLWERFADLFFIAVFDFIQTFLAAYQHERRILSCGFQLVIENIEWDSLWKTLKENLDHIFKRKGSFPRLSWHHLWCWTHLSHCLSIREHRLPSVRSLFSVIGSWQSRVGGTCPTGKCR